MVNDAEATAGSRGQSAPDGWEDPAGAEAADGIPGPEGDVHGMGGPVRRSGPMRDTRAAPRSQLTTGAPSSTAPGRGDGKGELDIASSRGQLDSAVLSF